MTDWRSDRASAKFVCCFSIVGAFALVIMIAVGAKAQTVVRPYALHDIRLGASLSEIRELRFLDDAARQKLRLICSTDADSAGIDVLHPLATVVRQDEVRCALYERGHANPQPVAGAMQIFGEMVQPSFLFYPERLGGEPHLGQIIARMSNERFQEIVAIMRRAYGPTSDYQMSSFRTVYGSMLNATYYWRNGVSSIEMTYRSLELDKMSIILTLNGLAG